MNDPELSIGAADAGTGVEEEGAAVVTGGATKDGAATAGGATAAGPEYGALGTAPSVALAVGPLPTSNARSICVNPPESAAAPGAGIVGAFTGGTEAGDENTGEENTGAASAGLAFSPWNN